MGLAMNLTLFSCQVEYPEPQDNESDQAISIINPFNKKEL